MDYESLLYETYRLTRVQIPDWMLRYADLERSCLDAFPSVTRHRKRHIIDQAFEEAGLTKEFQSRRPKGMDEAYDIATLFRYITLIRPNDPPRLTTIRID